MNWGFYYKGTSSSYLLWTFRVISLESWPSSFFAVHVYVPSSLPLVLTITNCSPYPSSLLLPVFFQIILGVGTPFARHTIVTLFVSLTVYLLWGKYVTDGGSIKKKKNIKSAITLTHTHLSHIILTKCESVTILKSVASYAGSVVTQRSSPQTPAQPGPTFLSHCFTREPI